MTTYYVDPAASGANDGSSWTDAWTNPQSAFDTATGGDTVYMRGTYTYGAATTIDIDTQTGSNANGFVKFIGCNAGGSVDGTRFVFDVNSQTCDGITVGAATCDMYWLENIEIKNADGNGFVDTDYSVTGWVFINCSFNNNTGDGIAGSFRLSYSYFIRCTSYSNSGDGFSFSGGFNLYFLTSSHDNGTIGFVGAQNYLYCLSYDNTDDGFGTANGLGRYLGCTINGNDGNGIDLNAATLDYCSFVAMCRITNHSGSGDIGLNANSEPIIEMLNYFEDNDGDNIQGATLAENISCDGTDSSSDSEDQADTNEGYVDLTDGAEDFGLRTDATYRRVAVVIPVS